MGIELTPGEMLRIAGRESFSRDLVRSVAAKAARTLGESATREDILAEAEDRFQLESSGKQTELDANQANEPFCVGYLENFRLVNR